MLPYHNKKRVRLVLAREKCWILALRGIYLRLHLQADFGLPVNERTRVLQARPGTKTLPYHNKKRVRLVLAFCYGGGSWIRSSEVSDNRFTVCPLWPLGNSPIWGWRTESNHQPADYKSAALPLSHASICCLATVFILSYIFLLVNMFFYFFKRIFIFCLFN